MAFTRGQLPELRTYAAAKEHCDLIRPLAGSSANAGQKPLGIRRRTEARIREADNGDIICVLLNTPVITYHPNNKITLARGDYYPSTLTASFISRVLGMRCWVQNNDLWLADRGEDTFLCKVFDGLVLKDLKPVNMGKLCVYNIDRKAMRAKRDFYKPFSDYARVLLSMLRGQTLEHEEEWKQQYENLFRWAALSKKVTKSKEFLKNCMTDDDEKRFKVLKEMLCTVNVGGGIPVGTSFNNDKVRYVMQIENPQIIIDTVDELIKYAHNEEVFYLKEVGEQKVVRDNNLKYIFRTSGQAV